MTHPIKGMQKELMSIGQKLGNTKRHLDNTKMELSKYVRKCNGLVTKNVELERRIEDTTEIINTFCDECPMPDEMCYECPLNELK